jgi:hypothetical protein
MSCLQVVPSWLSPDGLARHFIGISHRRHFAALQIVGILMAAQVAAGLASVEVRAWLAARLRRRS